MLSKCLFNRTSLVLEWGYILGPRYWPACVWFILWRSSPCNQCLQAGRWREVNHCWETEMERTGEWRLQVSNCSPENKMAFSFTSYTTRQTGHRPYFWLFYHWPCALAQVTMIITVGWLTQQLTFSFAFYFWGRKARHLLFPTSLVVSFSQWCKTGNLRGASGKLLLPLMRRIRRGEPSGSPLLPDPNTGTTPPTVAAALGQHGG